MIRVLALALLTCAVAFGAEQPARRVVILKIDGLNADLLCARKIRLQENRCCHGSLIFSVKTARSSRTFTRAASVCQRPPGRC
jgi:hypothetical protein